MADNNSNNSNVNKGNMGNQAPRFNGYNPSGNNLKNNLAKGAATAVGGPAAGKAVEALNKVKNNPNNGYLNNKNRGNGQANNYSSGLGESTSETGETNQENTSTGSKSGLGGLTNVLGGNKSTKINEDDSTTTKAIKTAMKIKKAMPIITALAPIMGAIVGVVTVVVIIMSQFAAIENFVAKISVGVEKMLNFVTGDGWMTNEDSFFKVLEDENKRYKKFSNNNENLDIPLIVATIHYDRVVDISAYEKKDAGNESYDPTSQDTSIIKSEETASFYGVATDFLGKINSLVIGNKKLLGHLVKTDVSWSTTNDISVARNGWDTFFAQVDYTKSDTIGETCNTALPFTCLISYYQEFITIYKNWTSYTLEYDDTLAYPEFSYENIKYELNENLNSFADIFKTVNDANNNGTEQNDGWIGYPVVSYSMDYDSYKKYLKEVFIPFTIYKDATIDDEINREIDAIIDEIFAQRDYYNYLFHNESEEGQTCELSGSTTQTVDIDTTYIADLKIKVLHPSCGKSINCSNVEYTVSLKEYVMGVVYREIGVTTSTPIEALKANLIAAKSYTLGRRSPKNGYITMRNNTYDQVYCNLDAGCMHYSSNRKSAPSAAVRKYLSDAYDEVANEFLYNTSSNKFTGSYRNTKATCAKANIAGSCLGHLDSEIMAKNGDNYNVILSTFYTGNIGLIDIGTKTVSFNSYECLNYSSSSGLISGGNYTSNAPIYADEKSFFANVNYNYYKTKKEAGSNYGECPWYAKGRAIEIIAYSNMPDDLKNKVINSLRNTYGNGADWYKNPSSVYFGKSTDLYAAKPGSIVSWSGGKSCGSAGCGHVGIIEDVRYDSNGKATEVLLTDGYNGTGNPANAHYTSRWMSIEKLKIFSTKRNYKFNGYVYLLG